MPDRAFQIAVGLSLALHGIAALALADANGTTRLVLPPEPAKGVRVRLAGPPQVEAPSVSAPPPVAAAPPRRERPEPVERPRPAERPEPAPLPDPKPAEPEASPPESAPTPALAALDLGHGAPDAATGSGAPDATGTAELPSTRTAQADASNRLARYVDEVRRRIEARKRYPAMARKRAVEGRVVARVEIRADGRVAGIEFDGGAPALLRRATGDAIRAAAPYPAPPAGAVTIELPVDYSLRDAS